MGSVRKMSSSFKRGSLKSSTSGSQKVSGRAEGLRGGDAGLPLPSFRVPGEWRWASETRAPVSGPLLALHTTVSNAHPSQLPPPSTYPPRLSRRLLGV